MALVRSSKSSTVAWATETVREVERQIELYISEQRAKCSWSHPSQGEVPSVPPSVSSYAYGYYRTRPRRRKSRPWHRRSTAQELLRAIFDTPECRTESSSALLACHLRRRGATFHRIPDAEVQATRRRLSRWASGWSHAPPADVGLRLSGPDIPDGSLRSSYLVGTASPPPTLLEGGRAIERYSADVSCDVRDSMAPGSPVDILGRPPSCLGKSPP